MFSTPFNADSTSTRKECVSGVRRSSILRDDQGSDGSDPLPDEDVAALATEMALHVLAYNLTRVMNIMGPGPLIAAIKG